LEVVIFGTKNSTIDVSVFKVLRQNFVRLCQIIQRYFLQILFTDKLVDI